MDDPLAQFAEAIERINRITARGHQSIQAFNDRLALQEYEAEFDDTETED